MQPQPPHEQPAFRKLLVTRSSLAEIPDVPTQSSAFRQPSSVLGQFAILDYPSNVLTSITGSAVGTCLGFVISALYVHEAASRLGITHATPNTLAKGIALGTLTGAIAGMLLGVLLGIALNSSALRRFEHELTYKTRGTKNGTTHSVAFSTLDEIQQWKRSQGEYSRI